MATVTLPTPAGVGSAVIAGMTRYVPGLNSLFGFNSFPAQDESAIWGTQTTTAFNHVSWGSGYGLPPLYTSTATFFASVKPVVGQTWAGRVKRPTFFGFLATGSQAWSAPNTSSTGDWGYTRFDHTLLTSADTSLNGGTVYLAPQVDLSFGTLPLISSLYAYDETTEVFTAVAYVAPPAIRTQTLTGTKTTTASITGIHSTSAALTGVSTSSASLTGTSTAAATMTGTRTTTATLTGSAGKV
jgi:hypothetical protein